VVDIRDFIGLLKHSRGDFAGQPFVLQPWQDEYLDKLFNTKKPDGLRRYRTSLLALPRKNGKALALDTPVLTTTGWTTMGSLKVGDEVFHPNGCPTRVIAATEVMRGRPCYGVRFSQGETIVADAEHLWYTNARIDRPGDGRGPCGDGVPGWRIRTTAEIAETCHAGPRRDRNHSVTVAAPVQFPFSHELPVDPYILGVWLGDGSSRCARVSVGSDDIGEAVVNMEAAGVAVSVYQAKGNYSVTLGGRKSRVLSAGTRTSVQSRLRAMGLLGNKHIPEIYLLASVTQRLSLLQGLMDTDGSISKAGECEFCNTNRRLAEGFTELAISLGLKATFKESVATLGGVAVGPKYRVVFTPLAPMKVFRLSRKQERVKSPPKMAARSRTRQIVSCDPVASVPVRCIQVESPDGMFLAGRSLIPTHNSAISAAVGLYMLCCDDEGAEVIVAAGDRSQAALLHTAAKQFVESCPSLAKRCKIYRNSIVFPEKNSTMLCISSEAGTKHGYNPSCVLVDEYHVFPDRELVDVLETGTGARSQPLTIYITTAGTDMDGPCYKDWQRAVKIRDGVLKDDSFLPCIYAADPEDDPFIEETWKKANPNYGITLKPEYFQQFAQKAKDSPADEVVFRTLHLDQWQRSETKWIRHGAWDANNAPLRPTAGRPCWCGVDLASTFDTTAFVAVWPDADGTYDVHAHFFIPEENAHKRSKEDRVPYQAWADAGFVTLTDGDITCYDTVRDYILSFCEKNAVRGIAIDRWNAVHLTTQLVAEGIDVKPFGQGFASMSAPSKLLETLCVSKRLRHAGNPVLAWQMSNVQVKIDDAGNIKPTKKHSHSTARIDGAVSLIMALGISSSESHGNTDEPTLMVL
jgi:phage terminase large subunit-like protein